MKRNLLIILGLLLLGGSAWMFTYKHKINDNLVNLIETADVEGLMAMASTDIILELYESEEYEDLQMVKYKLQEFFDQNPPKKFVIRHYGESDNKSSSYMIGILHTDNSNYRVSIMLDNEKIEQISIEFKDQLG